MLLVVLMNGGGNRMVGGLTTRTFPGIPAIVDISGSLVELAVEQVLIQLKTGTDMTAYSIGHAQVQSKACCIARSQFILTFSLACIVDVPLYFVICAISSLVSCPFSIL